MGKGKRLSKNKVDKDVFINEGPGTYTVLYEDHHKKIRTFNIDVEKKEDAVNKFYEYMRNLFKLWYFEVCSFKKEEYDEKDMESNFKKVVRVLDCNRV